MTTGEAIVFGVQIWGGIGLFVAALFLFIGIDRIDEDAQGAYVFRPLLIPGIMLIWPLVLWRWWQIESGTAAWLPRYQPVRQGHGVAIVIMSIVIVVAFVTGMSVRQTWPEDFVPQQLTKAE